jgi:hypothetical protein
MVLGKVIGTIESTCLPMNDKLALARAVADPVKAHVDGLRSFLLDGVVDDALGAGIASLDWGSRLRVPEFGECLSKHAGILSIVK